MTCDIFCCDKCSQPAHDAEIQDGKRICVRCVAAQREKYRRLSEGRARTILNQEKAADADAADLSAAREERDALKSTLAATQRQLEEARRHMGALLDALALSSRGHPQAIPMLNAAELKAREFWTCGTCPHLAHCLCERICTCKTTCPHATPSQPTANEETKR